MSIVSRFVFWLHNVFGPDPKVVAIKEYTNSILRDGCIDTIQRVYDEFEKNKEEIMKSTYGKQASAVFAEALHAVLSRSLVIPNG